MVHYYWDCENCNFSSTDYLLPENETPNECPRCGGQMVRDSLPRMGDGGCYECNGWGCDMCEHTGGY